MLVWFTMARRYVAAHADRWFILSAEHGLLDPEAVIKPYDKTLNYAGVEELRKWADRVKLQLEVQCVAGDRALVLAGLNYRRFLLPTLRGQV